MRQLRPRIDRKFIDDADSDSPEERRLTRDIINALPFSDRVKSSSLNPQASLPVPPMSPEHPARKKLQRLVPRESSVSSFQVTSHRRMGSVANILLKRSASIPEHKDQSARKINKRSSPKGELTTSSNHSHPEGSAPAFLRRSEAKTSKNESDVVHTNEHKRTRNDSPSNDRSSRTKKARTDCVKVERPTTVLTENPDNRSNPPHVSPNTPSQAPSSLTPTTLTAQSKGTRPPPPRTA